MGNQIRNKCRLCLKETGFNHMLISDAIGSEPNFTLTDAVKNTFDVSVRLNSD